MSKFWDKVEKCEHKNMSPNYNPLVRCLTPYCSAWESHCLDCGVYISDCQCGSTHGMSGWPINKIDNLYRKKWDNALKILKERREKYESSRT